MSTHGVVCAHARQLILCVCVCVCVWLFQTVYAITTLFSTMASAMLVCVPHFVSRNHYMIFEFATLFGLASGVVGYLYLSSLAALVDIATYSGNDALGQSVYVDTGSFVICGYALANLVLAGTSVGWTD